MAFDVQLANNGLLNPQEFRMKWYGEDEATAKRMLPDAGEGIEPPFEESE